MGVQGMMGRGKRQEETSFLSFLFPVFPVRFNFSPLPSLRAFLPSTTVGGLCGGESENGGKRGAGCNGCSINAPINVKPQG